MVNHSTNQFLTTKNAKATKGLLFLTLIRQNILSFEAKFEPYVLSPLAGES
jgi:hypothetical protein